MTPQFQSLFNIVENHKEQILDAERHIWRNPETGFKEWKTHNYLKQKFEEMGYNICEAGNIPGFYVDIETGKPGPKIGVFAEMDALTIPSHPESDPETGAVHSCGHHCQCAAMIGIASALKQIDTFENLCGSIRLFLVPAEESGNRDFRRVLRENGTIKYLSGKLEFMYRGYLDGVDMAMMIHTRTVPGFRCIDGSNGSLSKKAIFRGKSSHAGGSPHRGHNALYAATTALAAANALRETFQEKDKVRFHAIITKGGSAVNVIPDEVICESSVRASSISAIRETSEKINLAFAGTAAAIGCSVDFYDEHGYAPRYHDSNLQKAFKEIALLFFSEEEMEFHGWAAGCSDMGDVSNVMPVIHPHIGGASGKAHSEDYYITDPVTACVTSAKIQLGVIYKLLSDNASFAKKVITECKVPYPNKEEYFKEIDTISFNENGVKHLEDGSVVLKYRK